MADASRLPSFDLDRVGIGDPLATRDALEYLRSLLNQQSQVQHKSERWLDVPYLAADFTSLDAANAAAGTWTVDAGDVVTFEMRRLGPDTIAVQFVLVTTTTSGAGTKVKLCIRLPRGYKIYPGQQYTGEGTADNNTGSRVGVEILADGATAAVQNQLQLLLLPIVTNWANGSANATSVRGSIVLRIANPGGS